MKKRGFTLAEVLVTLGIIGVVAAITMPSLMGNTNTKQLEAQFNTANSVLSQAVYTVAGQKGPGLKKLYYQHDAELKDILYKQLKTDGECRYNRGEIKNYSKTKTGYPRVYVDKGTITPATRLQNGMCVDLVSNAGDINITVDTNGIKKPNTLGHDIFYFTIGSDDKLTPRQNERRYSAEEVTAMERDDNTTSGVPNVSGQAGNPCSKDSAQAGNGLGCAYYAILNQSPDDSTKSYWNSLP